MANTIVADVMAPQGSRVSATMALTLIWLIPIQNRKSWFQFYFVILGQYNDL